MLYSTVCIQVGALSACTRLVRFHNCLCCIILQDVYVHLLTYISVCANCVPPTITVVMRVCICVHVLVCVLSTQTACSADITVIIPGLDAVFLSLMSRNSLRMHQYIQYYTYENPFPINQPQNSLLSFCLPKKIKAKSVNKDASLKNPASYIIFIILCLVYEL